MIAQLRGLVALRTKEQVIVDVHGVGYGLVVPETVLFRMPEVGQEVVLQVYTHVREDAILLFGFLSILEKETFEILISASGVGPKLATAILSSLDAGQLLNAIASENKAALNGITGVGKKTAERLVLELKEKCEKKLLLERGTINSQAVRSSATKAANIVSWQADLESALLGLGYRDADFRNLLKDLAEHPEITNLESALKWSLAQLTKRTSIGLRGNA